jgi:hypothetical protein
MQDDPAFLEFELKPELIQKMIDRAERQTALGREQEPSPQDPPPLEQQKGEFNSTKDTG